MANERAAHIPGGRSFVLGAVVLLLLAVAHSVAAAVGAVNGPGTPAEAQVQAQMQAFQLDFGPLKSSLWGALQVLSMSYALFAGCAGLTNLLAMKPCASAGRLRAITMVNIVLCLALAAVSAWWQLLPALVFALVALCCYCVSFLQQRTAA